MTARLRIPALLAAALLAPPLAACDGDPAGPRAREPAQVAAASGDGQSAAAGERLPAPVAVTVTDRRGRPVAGTSVRWTAAPGEGSPSASVTVTDAAGRAQVEWTLGTRSGAQTLEAAAGTLPPARFAATALAGAAVRVEMAGGDRQTAVVGAAVPSPLVVRAVDAHGNPVRGARVSWVPGFGGGSVAPVSAATDSAGLVRAAWTLGTRAGDQAVFAGLPDAPGSMAVLFFATALPGPPSRLLVVNPSPELGWTFVGTPFAQAPRVRVVDAHGNEAPGPGTSVRWTVTRGSGSVDPAVAPAGPDGAATRWTPLAAGATELTASLEGVQPATFTGTAATRAGGTVAGSAAWTREGSPYVLDEPVTVPYGATLTLEPGTVVGPGGAGESGGITVEGVLLARGTAAAPVVLHRLRIAPRGGAAEPFRLEMAHVRMERGTLDLQSGGSGYVLGAVVLRDSRFTALGIVGIRFPAVDCYLERNVFVPAEELPSGNHLLVATGAPPYAGARVYVRNNLFYRDPRFPWPVLEVAAALGESETVLELNTFMEPGSAFQRRPMVALAQDAPDARLRAASNYWGTTDEARIRTMVDPRVEFRPYLAAPHPDTPRSTAAARVP